VVTYDGTSQKVYLNGSLAKEESASANMTVVTGFSIGRDFEANIQYLTGMLDELKIYNRAISLTEVQTLYSGSSGSSGSAQAVSFSASGTVGGETITLNSSSAYANISSNQFRIYGNDINFEFEFENLIPTQTGTYAIGSDFSAIDFANEDSQYNLHAYEGSVILTSISPKFEGTFTLTQFATGHGGTANLSANITGSFSVDHP